MGVTLLNIDCMEYMAGLPDKAFDLAIVDPPYGIGDSKLTQGGTWAAKYKKGDASWDIAPPKEYFTELFRVSSDQIIWGGNYFDLPTNRHFIIWDKVAHMETMADCEYAWSSMDKNAKIFKSMRSGNTTGEERIHICQKPVVLYKWLLSKYAQPGMKILDTHLGSGSSAIAAHRMDFDFVGTEISPTYYAAACKRFKEQTAQTKLF